MSAPAVAAGVWAPMTKPRAAAWLIGIAVVLLAVCLTGKVGIEFAKGAHVTLVRIEKLTRGAALRTPIHRCDRKTATAKVGDHLEVFLDVFPAALK